MTGQMRDKNDGPPEAKPPHRLGFPEAWIVLVAVPAAGYGLALGRVYPGRDTVPVVWYTGVPAAACLVLGVIGGRLFGRVRDVAVSGAAGLVGFFLIGLWLGKGAPSLTESDQGGLGLVIGLLFVIAFVPMLAGAFLGSRPHYDS
jgi:hypothetical protein